MELPAMPATSKPTPRFSHMRRVVHGLVLATEVAHRADIITYSSGHLNPCTLNPAQYYVKKKNRIWKMSETLEELDPQTLRQRQAVVAAKAEKMKDAMYEFTAATLHLVPKAPTPEKRTAGKLPQDSNKTVRRPPRMVMDPSELLLVKPRRLDHTKCPGDTEKHDRFWFTQSHLAGLTKKDQLRMMQQFNRQIVGKQDLRDRNCLSGSKAAEVYERKLRKVLQILSGFEYPRQYIPNSNVSIRDSLIRTLTHNHLAFTQELQKLSVQSWPSRERLGVFSDVFDDVCVGSPVFGGILREIKTDYDLYLLSLIVSQPSLQDMSLMASLGGLDSGVAGTEDLQEAGWEVSRLGEEAQRALEENDRVRNDFQSARGKANGGQADKGIQREAVLPGPKRDEGTGSIVDRVQPKRRQVWNLWEEVQLLEKEIKETMVSVITTGATERCIRDSKAEIMRLAASNERFRNTNKDLENNINMVLDRAKDTDFVKEEVWDKIWSAIRREEE